MSIDETPPVICISKHGGNYIYRPDDTHGGMIAALRLMSKGSCRDFAIKGVDLSDDVLFEEYWRWMRDGRQTFIMSEGDVPRWVVEMKVGFIDAMSWDVMKSTRHRTPHYTGMSDGALNQTGYSGGYVQADFTPDEVPPDVAEWIDRECNRWMDGCCGDEGYRHTSWQNSVEQEHDHVDGLAMSRSWRDRLRAASSILLGQRSFERLADDESGTVRMALARNRVVRAPSTLARLASDPNWRVRRAVCQNAGVCIDYARFPDYGREFDQQWIASMVMGLANDTEYEVRLAAAEVVAHSHADSRCRGDMVAAVLDSRHDDDFKADFSTIIMEE